MVTSISYGRAFSWLGLLSGSHTTREVTPHARTAMELIQQFVPVRFEIASDREADARRLRGRPRTSRWIAATLDRESRAFGTRVE